MHNSKAHHQLTGVSKTTCFQFQDRFFKQLQGAAKGSPISPIVGNLYMEDFEIKAINIAKHPLRIWKRYVDNTLWSWKHQKKISSWNTSTV